LEGERRKITDEEATPRIESLEITCPTNAVYMEDNCN
jgi:hypothetical protein